MKRFAHIAAIAGLCAGIASFGARMAHEAPITHTAVGASAAAASKATDLGDLLGVCQEDEPCWSCVDDGNRVCGPGNANHVPAGCYDDGGVLEFTWPCSPWRPEDGYRHADGSVTLASGPNAYDEGAYVGGYN
ncbi:hypothetical protein MINTMi27_15490 [Mycobacterium intracellulare]|nr:hypothetical protein MINTMi27_15490 [Mycobacterium intracellulare]